MICNVCLGKLRNRFEEDPADIDSYVAIPDDRDTGDGLEARDQVRVEWVPVIPATRKASQQTLQQEQRRASKTLRLVTTHTTNTISHHTQVLRLRQWQPFSPVDKRSG